MKIADIRKYLKDNPKYYSDKNITPIGEISSGKKYYFNSDCGHEFISLPTNVFINGKITCPVCSGRQVAVGVNDLWTTHPSLAKMLVNAEDGYKHSIGSNKKLEWVCQDCGSHTFLSPIKMSSRLSHCTNCSKLRSYGEKYVTEMLNQLCEIFEVEKAFDWSNGKRYDFYLPEHNCIIEVNGKQHYSDSDFSCFGGKTYIEEQLNDNDKKILALEHGISNYIYVKNINSDANELKENILNSLLPTILLFNKDDIDWKKCHDFTLTSRTKMICDYYENVEKDFDKIADHFKCCRNTVRKHLKDGKIIGLCSYDPELEKQKALKDNGDRIIKTMSKTVIQMDIDNNFISRYQSIQEAQRQLNISHIWDCIVGRRKTAGGYKWKYDE